jgi:hypothetical protein
MTYARVVILLRLYLLEQCLNPVLRTSIKTRNFVTIYEFLIHLGVHHTMIYYVVRSEDAPTKGHRCHSHTVGDDACAWFGLNPSGARVDGAAADGGFCKTGCHPSWNTFLRYCFDYFFWSVQKYCTLTA